MAAEYSIEVLASRANSVYQLGEIVRFLPLINSSDGIVDPKTIDWKILKDNQDLIASGTVDLDKPGDCAETVLDCPGFLECEFTYTPKEGSPVSAKYGAAVSPDKIAPSMPVPEDFDEFWDRQKERLAAVPIDVQMSRLPSDNVELIDVQVSCIDGVPVSGYLVRPAHCGEKQCPAVILPHGAGVGSSGYYRAVQLAMMGYVAFDINAHGLPNGRSVEYYADLAQNELADYPCRGFDKTRDDVYFLNMFLRVKRVIEFMTERTEWDGKNLFLMGHSQGGFQTLAGAYLDDRVTAIAVGVPAGSDLTGDAIGRVTGWPRPDLLFSERGADRDMVLNNVRYFDNMNFASRIKVPAIFSVGFVDACCKPTTVYAVYNNYAGPKTMINRPGMGHEAPRKICNEFADFLETQVRK